MKPCDVTLDEQKIIEQINGDLKKKYWKTQKKKKVKEKKRTNNRQDNRGRITGKRKSKGEKEKDLNL